MGNYQATRDRIKELREAAKEQAKQAFREGANELFDKFPVMESFSWQQYTPYFNDGDTCHFSVRCDEPEINGESDIWEQSTYGSTTYPASNPELLPAQQAVAGFVSAFDEEDLLAMFGDHAEITVTRSSIDVDGYDHD